VPASVLFAASEVGQALVPVIVGVTVDRAIRTGDGGQLIVWLAVLGATMLLISLTGRFGPRLGYLGNQLVQHRLRTTVTDVLLSSTSSAAIRRSARARTAAE
jgi:hypothetical protein